jgi:hypothetical protein
VLRYVELNNRDENAPWSVRQTAIYQKYRNPGASTWAFVAISQRAEERLDMYLRTAGSMDDLNPFEIHLLLLDTAMANWRPYMVYLTAETNKQVCIYCPPMWQIVENIVSDEQQEA